MNKYLTIIFFLSFNAASAFCCMPKFGKKSAIIPETSSSCETFGSTMDAASAYNSCNAVLTAAEDKIHLQPLSHATHSTQESVVQTDNNTFAQFMIGNKRPQLALHTLIDNKLFKQATEYLRYHHHTISIFEADDETGKSYLTRIAPYTESENRQWRIESNELRLMLLSYGIFHAIDRATYSDVLWIVQNAPDSLRYLRHESLGMSAIAYARHIKKREAASPLIPGRGQQEETRCRQTLTKICALLENPEFAQHKAVRPPEIIIPRKNTDVNFREARNVFEHKCKRK